MAPHSQRVANPFAGVSAGQVLCVRDGPRMRMLVNPGGCGRRAGTGSQVHGVPHEGAFADGPRSQS
jgi:hypothetical protein